MLQDSDEAARQDLTSTALLRNPERFRKLFDPAAACYQIGGIENGALARGYRALRLIETYFDTVAFERMKCGRGRHVTVANANLGAGRFREAAPGNPVNAAHDHGGAQQVIIRADGHGLGFGIGRDHV